MGMAVLVLLMATVNVASLLLGAVGGKAARGFRCDMRWARTVDGYCINYCSKAC